MNKKFYFALALTAGLFASCSSDDVVSQAPSRVLDENAPVKIEFGVGKASAEVTRGTGTVENDDEDSAMKWEGQEISVLMLEKGKLNLALDADGNEILKGKKFAVEGNVAKIADEDEIKYYPAADEEGNLPTFDFWAYRLDGAGVVSEPAQGEEAEDGDTFNGLDDENATKITVPFTIDGTQDIMVAETKPTENDWASSHADLIYSAKSARNGVKPNFNFTHLLTQLTFKVKATAKELTASADDPITNVSEYPAYKAGYVITDVIVKSKSTGELVVAFTGETAPADTIEWAEEQDWATRSSLADFHLMTRSYKVSTADDGKADIKFFEIAANGQTSLSYPDGYQDETGAEAFDHSTRINDDLLVYATEPEIDDETGLPVDATPVKLGDLVAESGESVHAYILIYKKGERSDAQVNSTYNLPDYNVSEAAAATTELVSFHDNVYSEDQRRLTWNETGSVGNPVPVGAPMLVAPADENGYQATVKYKYWKKTTGSTIELVEEESQPVNIKVTDIYGTPGKFARANNYNVTLLVYSNGSVSLGDVTGNPIVEGGDIEAGEED